MNSTDRMRFHVLGRQLADERGEQRTGDAGEERRDGERDQLVLDLRHAHDLGGDVAVADRLQRPPGAGADEVLGEHDRDDQQREAEQVRLLRRR